jgi:hypothetical protein
MPLPFAPPPSESKLYRDLKNIKLDELTAVQFDSLKGALFAQGVDSSEDEMRRLNLVGQASNQQSASGPIPGTTKIVSDAQVGDATTAEVFRPDNDKSVWSLDTADVTHGGGAGASIRTRLKLYDGSNLIEIGDESFAGNTNPFEPKGDFGPVYVTYDVYLVQQVTGSTGGDEETSTVNVSVTRVR